MSAKPLVKHIRKIAALKLPSSASKPARFLTVLPLVATVFLASGASASPAHSVSVGSRSGTAPTPAAKIPPLVAYGDSVAIDPKVDTAKLLGGLPVCVSASKANEPDFPAALQTAMTLVTKGRGARGTAELDVKKYSGTPGRAEVTAGGLVMEGLPAGALAVLLDAEKRSPKSPLLLVDASVSLTELGQPNLALAFLDQARRLGGAKGAPMGLSNSAIALNDRGYALLGLGRYAAAQTVLGTAVHNGGLLLSEAARNLSLANHCLHKDPAAKSLLFASAYRQQYKFDDIDTGSVDPVLEYPNPTELGFDSPRETNGLPSLKIPSTPEAAADTYLTVDKYYNAETQREIQLGQRLNGISVYSSLLKASPLTRQRTYDILDLIAVETVQQPWSGLYDKVTNAQAEVQAYLQKWWEPGGYVSCSNFGTIYPHWLGLVDAYDKAVRQFVNEEGSISGPLLAGLGNLTAHEYLKLSVKDFDLILFNGLLQQVAYWTRFEGEEWDGCTKQNPSGYGEFANGQQTEGDPGPCPPWLKKFKIGVKIPGLGEIRGNCESVGVKVDGPKLIGDLVKSFGSVDANRHGEVTVVAGASVNVGGGAVPFKADFKEGFYVKVDADGVKDFGFRVGPSAGVSTANYLVNYGDSVDISLVGSIDYIPTALGLR
jgi:hypothetical protein